MTPLIISCVGNLLTAVATQAEYVNHLDENTKELFRAQQYGVNSWVAKGIEKSHTIDPIGIKELLTACDIAMAEEPWQRFRPVVCHSIISAAQKLKDEIILAYSKIPIPI